MRYFTSPEDLALWVLSNKNPNEAISKFFDIIGAEDLSIKEGCVKIFDNNLQKNRSEDKEDLNKEMLSDAKALYISLSKYGITEIKKNGEVKMSKNHNKMKKEAQYRHPGPEITYNRETDNAYNGTPWRRDRDMMFGFIHRNPDMISFGDDPNMVYSGEALWRAYVMDKFYRDYKDENGKVVGGYINDRFHVFPTAGTPDNPDAPRDGGNQMELANGERTRKPRPHQYSVERRLEEARGNKCEDITALASSKNMVKLASSEFDLKSIDKDDVFNVFKDVIDMRQAGFNDEDIICKIADHYKMDVVDVTALHRLATRQVVAHKNIVYTTDVKKKVKTAFSQVDNSKTLVAIPNTKVVLVYGDDSGSFSVQDQAYSFELPKPVAVFPVNGAFVNSSPVFASDFMPQIVYGQYPETKFFVLQDSFDIDSQIMDIERFHEMLLDTMDTGLIDADENQINVFVNDFKNNLPNKENKELNQQNEEQQDFNIEENNQPEEVIDM